ncbi:MAG: Spy/CpxP family protein refolding chaperone [Thermoanaerobaculia bacterium]
MVRKIGLFVVVLLMTSMTEAEGQQLPPGKWWQRPEVVTRLGLTPDQRGRLDEVLRRSAPELVELRDEMESSASALREQLDRPNLDREAVRKAAEDVSSARARLFERELMMLVDMRRELKDEQWNRFRALIESRPGQGPPAPGMQERRGPPQPGSRRGRRP